MSKTKKPMRPAEDEVPERTKVVEDAQAPRNEAQQQPSRSGDPRTSNAVGVPMPYGIPTDDLHPITQPQGDVSDPSSAPPGVTSEEERQNRLHHQHERSKKSA